MGSCPDTDIDPHLVTFVSQGLFLWRHYICFTEECRLLYAVWPKFPKSIFKYTKAYLMQRIHYINASSSSGNMEKR